MIQILDKKTADKIAAGEVIDRPVSIVKELIENSIDSGASAITTEIRDGGKSYIRITDNGSGIAADEAAIAFKRHATSKISKDTDLDSISTLGFRGEALASICAVSRVEMITKTAEARMGRKIIAENSEIISDLPTGCPEGTTITVQDLFYNVPARRKFLASDASEARKVIDLVSRISLSYPDIRFTLINGRRILFTTSGRGRILDNITGIYGTDLSRDLLPVSKKMGKYTIRGFVSNPGFTMSSRLRQIFCVNGRVISSPLIEKAVSKAYEERIFNGRFPVAFLFISMPADEIDVNIHPTKKEIRFNKAGDILDFVFSAVSEALKTPDAVPAVHKKNNASKVSEDSFNYSTGSQVDVKTILSTMRKKESQAASLSKPTVNNQPVDIDNVKYADNPVRREPFDFDDLTIIGSLFNTYILATDGLCLYMLDQHAAHERIFYEKLMSQYESSDKLSQQLLSPLNFQLAADLVEMEENWIGIVKSIGYDIEFFGNNTYIVRAIPAFMNLQEGENFLRDIFHEFGDTTNLTTSSARERIIMNSCKAAVKAGDLLREGEISSLIDQLKKCSNPFSCPHGRPSFIRMTKYEIERMFKRV